MLVYGTTGFSLILVQRNVVGKDNFRSIVLSFDCRRRPISHVDKTPFLSKWLSPKR